MSGKLVLCAYGIFGLAYRTTENGELRLVGSYKILRDGETRGRVKLKRRSRQWRLLHSIGYTIATAEETVCVPISSFDSIAVCEAFFV